MRVHIRDDVLRRLAEDPGFAPKGWGSDVIRSFRKKLQLLDAAKDDRDVRALKALRLEKLSGNRAGTSSIRLNGQYRVILRFETDDEGRFVIILELVDYH
ncbi:proteic killer suppression protein [Rathayibacter agropyri]